MTNNSQLCPTVWETEEAKIVMRVYAKTAGAIRAIERQILKSALASFNYKRGSSTLDQCNKIIDLIETKETYLRFRSVVEKILSKTEDEKLLTQRFVEHLQFADIADKAGWSLRNCFRRYDAATRQLATLLAESREFAALKDEFKSMPLYELEKRRSEEKLAEISGK